MTDYKIGTIYYNEEGEPLKLVEITDCPIYPLKLKGVDGFCDGYTADGRYSHEDRHPSLSCKSEEFIAPMKDAEFKRIQTELFIFFLKKEGYTITKQF